MSSGSKCAIKKSLAIIFTGIFACLTQPVLAEGGFPLWGHALFTRRALSR